jgi:pimeloyl-ACP methyl ester carboxylesterase
MAKPSGQTDHRVRLPAGRMLGYREYGDPQGSPILYFHGTLSCRVDIAFAEETFRRRGLRLIAVDRPGMGISEYQPDYKLLDWPDDIAALSQELGLGRFDILGWSGGGTFALACAYKIPHLVKQVSTAGCCPPLDHPGGINELGMWSDRLILQMVRTTPWLVSPFLMMFARLPATLMKASLLSDLTSAGDKAALQDLPPGECVDFFYEAMSNGADGSREEYRILGSSWGFRPEDIQAPVLFFHGEEDELCPTKHARALAERIPNAKLQIVPSAGHFLLRKNTDLILDVILQANRQEQPRAI